MRLHGPVDEARDLGVACHVRLHGGVGAERKLLGERLEPVETPRAQDQLRPVLGEATRGGFPEPAARAGDDDDLVLDPFRHGLTSSNVRFGAPSGRSAAGQPLKRLGVPIPFDLDLRGGALDLAEIDRREFKSGRSDVLPQTVEFRGAGDRRDPRLLGE